MLIAMAGLPATGKSSLAASLGCPSGIVALTGSIGAAAVAQRRGNERPTSDQEFLTIGKIVI